MNRRSKAIVSLIALAFIFFKYTAVASAQEAVNKDWILRIQTEELSRQFQYNGSPLKEVEKVTVEYFHESNPSNIRPYERVYFNHGKPIGMERTGSFGLAPLEIIAIKVSHKSSGNQNQEKASANMIWRMALTCSLHHNQLISTILPSSSFSGIVRELKDLGFEPSRTGADQANKAKCILVLESDDGSTNTKLCYY